MSEHLATPPPFQPDETELSKAYPPLSSGLKWSFGFHLALFLGILIQSWIYPGKPLRYIPTLKVDLVALPDLLKKDLKPVTLESAEIQKILDQAEESAKKIQKAAAKPAPPAAEEEMAVHTKKKAATAPSHNVENRNKRALDRIRALEKIQNMNDSTQRASEKIKGNKLSAGASRSGHSAESLEANYLEVLRERIADHWFLPPWLARQNLSSLVRIQIDSHGRMKSHQIERASGSEPFDQAVNQALDQSQPFPIPPEELQHSLVTRGISVGFPL